MLDCSESNILPKATLYLSFYGQLAEILAVFGVFGGFKSFGAYLRVSDGYLGLGIIWEDDGVWFSIVGGRGGGVSLFRYFGCV